MNPKSIPQSICTFLCKSTKAFLCMVMAFSLFPFMNTTTAQTRKPNIILILADDVGYETLGVNGGKYSTPNLDTMAFEGMNFTQCHASPLCSPSRFMLLTGKYNFRNYTKWGYMDTAQKTMGNMFHDAGFKTACFGKWQLDGGDESIHAFGFDSYAVINPMENSPNDKYKNPDIYTNGAFAPDSLTEGKYGEDIFTDSVMNFIENNKTSPFFIYYPMGLAHGPFLPTPDDSVFATWTSGSDTSFYPSMIEYMDKKVGEIIQKVKSEGLENNTVIIYIGDNGSRSIFLDSSELGGKESTLETGLRVPMIVYWSGVVKAGSVNHDLVGFTDFLISLADIANIPIPDYGPLDGVNFAPRLTGNPGTPREWLFYHYQPYPENTADTLKRWAQTIQYKLYDTSVINSTRLFYNIINDPNELNPIPDGLLTPGQAAIKRQLLNVIKGYIAQGLPILGDPQVLSATDSSITIIDSIKINGGSTITSSGVVWSTKPNPVLSSGNHTSDNGYKGKFNSFITGLTSSTIYYIRTYATNLAGTVYSKEIIFSTPPKAPICNNATEINNASFVANWDNLDGAYSYKIDVSTFRSFSIPEQTLGVEEFNSGRIPPTGWIFSKGIGIDTIRFGKTSPSVKFRDSNQSITTAQYPSPVTMLSFFIKGIRANAGSLLVEGFDGARWKTIEIITNISKSQITRTYDSASTPALKNNFIQFRFTYNRLEGALVFDDVVVNYIAPKPSFIPGYENVSVTGNSQSITGLTRNMQYYYRVRAENSNGISGNSNTIAVITDNAQVSTPVCINATEIDNTSFVANWNNLDSVNDYKIDVSTSPSFSVFIPGYKDLTVKTNSLKIPGLKKNTQYYYRVRAENNSNVSGNSNTIAVTTNNVQINAPVCTNATEINTNSFIANWNKSDKADSYKIDIGTSSSFAAFVSGYKDLTVKVNSLKITGLASNTTSYYRVRAISINLDDTSENSNTIEAITSTKPINSDTTINIFPNPSINEFTLTIPASGNKPIQVVVTDLRGKEVYKFSGNNSGKYVLGKSFAAGIYFVQIIQGDITKTIKLVKVGR